VTFHHHLTNIGITCPSSGWHTADVYFWLTLHWLPVFGNTSPFTDFGKSTPN
jgi:hypothetical protein